MSRKKNTSPPSMWEDAEEVPRAGIPSTKTLSRRMLWGRVLVWAVILTFPVMGLALISTAASLKSATAASDPVVAVDTVSRAAAINAVNDWLTTVPSPLPGGTLVSWDSSKALPAYVAQSTDTAKDRASAADLTEHSLTVRGARGGDGQPGVTFIAQVLIASNAQGESTAIGTPSLLPVAPDSTWALTTSPWPNLVQTTASPTVAAAVQAWTVAFSSGDPAALRLVVGDPKTDHAYVPMTGLVSAASKVTSAAWVKNDAGEPTSSMLVQVQVVFTWPTTPTKQSGAVAAATYDLLVTGADSGAPSVSAWGGMGTGPTLTPYVNAVVGRELVAATGPAPTQKASAEPSVAPTGIDTPTKD